ncbi:hypothetical protein EBZ39_04860 [bacterium]|nr:hypothetical protein [bacterium]
MDGAVEFVLRVRDMMSGGLRGAATTAHRSFNEIGAGMERVAGRGQRMGSRVVDALTGISNSARAATREVRQLDDMLEHTGRRKSNGIGFMDFVKGGLVTQGITSAVGFAIEQVKGVMTGGMEAEKLRAQFGVLAGKDAGGALYKDLTKWIGDSVFGTEQYANARTMLGFGIKANEVVPAMKMLGDISMGDTEKMGGLSLAYSQVRGAGKLQGQDLLQFISNGYNPLEDMSRMTGKSMATLKEEMGKGAITFDMVAKAMEAATSKGGKYYGMLEQIGKTDSGRWEAMVGNIGTAMQDMGEKLKSVRGRLIDYVTEGAKRLPAMMDRVVPYLERFGDAILEISPVVEQLGGKMMSALKPVIDFVLSKEFTNLVGNVGRFAGGLMDMGAPLITELTAVIGGLSQQINNLSDYLRGSDFFRGMKEHASFSFIPYPIRAKMKMERDENPEIRNANTWLAGMDFIDFPYPTRAMLKGKPLVPALAGVASPAALARNDGKGGGANLSASNEAIVGGGRKNITININHPLVKQDIKVEGAADAFRLGLSAFEENLARALNGISMSLGG